MNPFWMKPEPGDELYYETSIPQALGAFICLGVAVKCWSDGSYFPAVAAALWAFTFGILTIEFFRDLRNARRNP